MAKKAKRSVVRKTRRAKGVGEFVAMLKIVRVAKRLNEKGENDYVITSVEREG